MTLKNFQEICDPGYAKTVKKLSTLEKIFFARNDLKHLKICSQHHLCSPRQISGRYFSKKCLSLFSKRCLTFSRNLWPRICKKSQKISNFRKKFFSLETILNALKFICNTICAVHDKFQAGISQKRSWSFFKKSVTLDMQKSKKIANFQKIFFRSKQPEAP